MPSIVIRREDALVEYIDHNWTGAKRIRRKHRTVYHGRHRFWYKTHGRQVTVVPKILMGSPVTTRSGHQIYVIPSKPETEPIRKEDLLSYVQSFMSTERRPR